MTDTNAPRLTFSRTIVKTYCEVTYIDQNNDKQTVHDLELLGDYDLATAQKPAIKKLNARGGVVTAIRHTSYYGTITIEDFDKYCTKTNHKEW